MSRASVNAGRLHAGNLPNAVSRQLPVCRNGPRALASDPGHAVLASGREIFRRIQDYLGNQAVR